MTDGRADQAREHAAADPCPHCGGRVEPVPDHHVDVEDLGPGNWIEEWRCVDCGRQRVAICGSNGANTKKLALLVHQAFPDGGRIGGFFTDQGKVG